MIRRGRSFSGNERHCCFLNTGGEDRSGLPARFADVSNVIGLDLIDDGRGLGVVDWDHDGDLDVWVANRTSPRVRMLRNDLRTGSNYLALRLRGVRCNRDAIGARVQVKLTNSTKIFIKTLRAGDGFLSQSSKWLHFGLGTEAQIKRVAVTWPGDDSPQQFDGIAIDGRYELIQDDEHARLVPQRMPPELKPSTLPPTKSSDRARIVLTQRRELPSLKWTTFNGQSETVNDGPRLVNLWASWCAPCISELESLKSRHDALTQAGLTVIALNVDQVTDETHTNGFEELARTLDLPFQVGRATTQSIRDLTELDHRILYRQKPLPVPCSFLLDSKGRVAIVYKGPVEVDQLLDDVQLLATSHKELLQAATPLGGQNITRWFSPDHVRVARAFLEGGYVEDAKAELNKELHGNIATSKVEHLPALQLWAEIARSENNSSNYLKAAQRIAKLKPDDTEAQMQLAIALRMSGGRSEASKILNRFEQQGNLAGLVRAGQTRMALGDIEQAMADFKEALAIQPSNPEVRFNLALAYQLDGQASQAIKAYRDLIDQYPNRHDLKNNLAWLLATESQDANDHQAAVQLADAACRATNNREPAFMDTLAVALAISGDLRRAREIAARGADIARAQGLQNLAEKLQRRLETNNFGGDLQ